MPNQSLVDFSAYASKLLLDVGCGVGNDLAKFAQGGARAVGIDLAPHSIELAKSNFSQRKLQGEFHVMNGEAMQFPAQTFDVVFCHTVLQFTPHPERMISEIWRVLKPGGTAIVMAINLQTAFISGAILILMGTNNTLYINITILRIYAENQCVLTHFYSISIQMRIYA